MLSFSSNNCKSTEAPTTEPGWLLKFSDSGRPTRSPRSLARAPAPAPDQKRTRCYTADDSGAAGAIFRNPSASPLGTRGAEAHPAGAPRPQRARGHIPGQPTPSSRARRVASRVVATLGNKKFRSRGFWRGVHPSQPWLPTAATLGQTRRRAPGRASSPPARGTAPRGAASLRAKHSPSVAKSRSQSNASAVGPESQVTPKQPRLSP